jgi:hypothetical protein
MKLITMRQANLDRFVDVRGASTHANPHDVHTSSLGVACVMLNFTAAISYRPLQLGQSVNPSSRSIDIVCPRRTVTTNKPAFSHPITNS